MDQATRRQDTLEETMVATLREILSACVGAQHPRRINSRHVARNISHARSTTRKEAGEKTRKHVKTQFLEEMAGAILASTRTPHLENVDVTFTAPIENVSWSNASHLHRHHVYGSGPLPVPTLRQDLSCGNKKYQDMDAADEWHKSNDNAETDMRSAMFMHRGLPPSHTQSSLSRGRGACKWSPHQKEVECLSP